MTRKTFGWLGTVLITLTAAVSCNLGDPVGSFKPPVCERDADCNDRGECILLSDELVCQCDQYFEGPNCGECVPGRVLEDGECVEEDTVEPDMGMDEPCLEINPDPLAFGEIELGRAAVLNATIRNCSDTLPLTVEDATVCLNVNDSCVESEVFELDMLTPELPATLNPTGSISARIRFTPEGGVSSGALNVSAGELSGSIELTGSAMGDCPSAEIEGSAAASGQWVSGTVPTSVGDVVSFRPQRTMGSIARYQWAVTNRPMGSTSTLSDPTAQMPTLLLDAAGDYTVELTVYDQLDTPSCSPATISVGAAPAADVVINLTWDTPGDMDQTDEVGSDMDLHFLHPNGMWNNAPWDIYWLNPTADWGAPGAPGNPVLVIDDRNGLGPERIEISDLEAVVYSVGAYYYSDGMFGRSTATVEIIVDGALVHSSSQLMSMTDFWLPATIRGGANTVTVVNTLQSGFP